jgi:excisionase family DNA binding protein
MEWRGRIGSTDEVTIGEAAELLKVSPRQVLDLVNAGRLPARTNLAVVRISRADIDLFRLRSASGATG